MSATQGITITDDRAKGLTSQVVDPRRYGEPETAPMEAGGLIAQLIAPCSRVLDVGCGTGGLGAMLQRERKADVIGVEPHATRADCARARGLTVHTGELTSELVASL